MTSSKIITIFGGTGFVGRYLIDRLCDQGFIVRVATRRPSSMYYLRTAGMVGQVAPVVCDVLDDNSLHQAVQGSHYVVNLIGVLSEKGRRQKFEKLHTEFPARLGSIAASCGVERLVHVSALGADENALSHYAQTKARGEQGLLKAFPKATIMRPGIVFGAEDGFFNRFARMAQVMPFVPLIGGGNTQLQPVYVGDVADAIMVALTTTSKDVQGVTFELGGADRYSFKELMQMMFTYTHQPRTLLSVPFGVAKVKGAFLQHLPGQILTVDQVRSLQSDNVLSNTKPGLRDLGIDITPLEAVLPTYLNRYRPGGRFARSNAA